MYPLTHFLFPFFIAQIFVKLNYLDYKLAIITGIIAVLIDLDHWIYRIIKFHEFNPKNAWNNAVKKHDPKERTFLHHKPGMILIASLTLILLFFSWKSALILALAYYSHILLDNLHLKLKSYLKMEEEGFIFKIPFYEIIFDLILILLIVLWI